MDSDDLCNSYYNEIVIELFPLTGEKSFSTACFSWYIKRFRVTPDYISFMSRILLIYHLLFLSSFLETKVVDVRGKPLSRGTVKGMAYAKFKVHKFSYLNITAIGSHYVGKGSECGFACVNIPSCFSFNLAEFQDINGKVLCELLPSDLYNNSDKLVPIQSHHHFSIAVSWI